MADFFNKLGSKLGSNLNDLGKIISEKAEVVSKKTEEAVEIQKIKSQIRVMERNNERDFQDIGKMVYENFKKGIQIDTEFVELCEAIEDREESIEEYNKQVADLKGMDVCQNCKEHLEADVVYCPKCGTKVERPEVVVEDAEIEKVEADEAEFEEEEIIVEVEADEVEVEE